MNSDRWDNSCPIRGMKTEPSFDFYFERAPDGHGSRPRRTIPDDLWAWPDPSLKPHPAMRAGVTWALAPDLAVEWELAPDDYRRDPKWKAGSVTVPRHLHTSFSVAGYELHIDYLRLMGWGPLHGYEEYRVFADGSLIGRGGGWAAPPGGGKLNWPLTVETAKFKIVIGSFPGDGTWAGPIWVYLPQENVLHEPPE